MKIRSALLLITTAFFFGCSASPRAAGSPEPVPASNPLPTAVPPGSSTWTITPTVQEQRYHSTASTLLELVDSTTTARDSVKSTVDFTLSVSRDRETLSYSTTIESMSVLGSQRTGTLSVTTHLPFSFAGRLQHGKLTISPQGSQPGAYTDCSNEALSTTATVQRAVVPVPLFLQNDMTWTDSTTASICSGSIPVQSTTSRRYKVIGPTNAGILIERRDKTFATGEGTQGQHRVRLQSGGTGMAQLVLDSRTGALIESAGNYITSVVITASGRDQKFTQTTRERISLR
jgi:hypothetical protein